VGSEQYIKEKVPLKRNYSVTFQPKRSMQFLKDLEKAEYGYNFLEFATKKELRDMSKVISSRIIPEYMNTLNGELPSPFSIIPKFTGDMSSSKFDIYSQKQKDILYLSFLVVISKLNEEMKDPVRAAEFYTVNNGYWLIDRFIKDPVEKEMMLNEKPLAVITDFLILKGVLENDKSKRLSGLDVLDILKMIASYGINCARLYNHYDGKLMDHYIATGIMMVNTTFVIPGQDFVFGERIKKETGLQLNKEITDNHAVKDMFMEIYNMIEKTVPKLLDLCSEAEYVLNNYIKNSQKTNINDDDF
jgi:hypothetical protein